METVRSLVETGTTVVLDGKYFIECELTRCTVVYLGGDFGWLDSKFQDCKLLLQGSADRTATLLRTFGWKPPEVTTEPPQSKPY